MGLTGELEALGAVENAGGTIVKPIFSFPAAGGSISSIRPAMKWRLG
ncbi:hypothetical protein [Mesorhizobium sp.]|nr:hypothetical protein [Mesorhizobium sp.]